MLKYVQNQPVPPGCCFIGDMALQVSETIKLVDHALSRMVHQRLLAEIEASGSPGPAVYNPSP